VGFRESSRGTEDKAEYLGAFGRGGGTRTAGLQRNPNRHCFRWYGYYRLPESLGDEEIRFVITRTPRTTDSARTGPGPPPDPRVITGLREAACAPP
jgi:hypothetical protein